MRNELTEVREGEKEGENCKEEILEKEGRDIRERRKNKEVKKRGENGKGGGGCGTMRR